MVDGDPQQNSELYLATKKYLVQAMLGGCHWHIVFQGWKRHSVGPGSIELSMKLKFDKERRRLCSWLHSYAKAHCIESEEEYELSKNLFFAYLMTKMVVKNVGGKENANKIASFARDYVFVHSETKLLYYKRKHVRHYHVATNSAHEGTNFGIKSHAASLKPCQGLEKSAKALSLQGVLKSNSICQENFNNVVQKKLWTSTLFSKHLNNRSSSILTKVLGRCSLYLCKRVGVKEWEVVYDYLSQASDDDGDINKTGTNSPIPRFKRYRLVTIDGTGCMGCTCSEYKSTGLPCVHRL